MRYGSVCSGIEAATTAWHQFGWTPAWFSEIESFPSAVLKHHYPTVPNHGDMTKFEEWPNEPIDLLVGGTPCQSFSVAGLRKGLADPRGNLMLTFLAIAQRQRPRWIVWENVPGVLSSNGGRDFGTFLGALGELGYGFAYRVLDAQWFGVAQRRRRVFVVGYLGDWQRPAKVLFESESVCRDTAPSREARKRIAVGVESGTGRGTPLVPVHAFDARQSDVIQYGDKTGPLDTDGHTIAVAQPVAFSAKDHGADATFDLSPTLRAMPHNESHANGGGQMAVMQPVGFDSYNLTETGEVTQTIKSPQEGVTESVGAVFAAMQVRRLTPVECERLQGFPDNYTNIPWRKKPESPDGPRYKALGNSMAVPVMRWIGKRIAEVEGG